MSLNTKFLHKDRFFRRSTTGTIILKRVSAELEEQFPRKYRELYRDAVNAGRPGATVLTAKLRQDCNCGLVHAWELCQLMFNKGVIES